jgi:hypothetical protein
MLMSRSNLEADPRAKSGLIANTALRLMEDGKNRLAAEAVAATWVRIFERYRYSAFSLTANTRGMFNYSNAPFEPLSSPPDDILERAITAAKEQIAPAESREQFSLEMIRAVQTCFGGNFDPRSAEATRLREFLLAFKDKIQR